ncbi:hypothetical protein [Actinoplanes sp. DH11]|uniref:hypothetical protein n=1 Tax=Actinoplanes sp. DH11 TaxID=2857011 RepID=UPI001E6470C4|nr:hypothetical protein [Actinoplanes sp. DH11]
MKIGFRNYSQGMGRWLAVAGGLVVVALLAAPLQAPEPGGDHPKDMDCGNVFWLTPPAPDSADPDYEFYRKKMDRGCREARVTRGVTAAMASGITVFGVVLLARRQKRFLP